MEGIEAMTVELLKTQFDQLIKSSAQVQEQIKDCADIIRRQNQMIDISIGLFESLANDKEIGLMVKRRIVFALQQMKGLAKIS